MIKLYYKAFINATSFLLLSFSLLFVLATNAQVVSDDSYRELSSIWINDDKTIKDSNNFENEATSSGDLDNDVNSNENNFEEPFLLFPNPVEASGFFNILFNDVENTRFNQVQIINYQGDIVYEYYPEFDINQAILQISLTNRFETGIYYVVGTGYRGTFQKKLVIE